MLLCALWFIGVFIVSIVLEFFTLGSPVIDTSVTSKEQKVFLDCQHSDYRTYIQCLKRQKRHHFDHGEIHAGYDHECIESCLKKCDFDCDILCKHCIRKAKHKHQIITEYETECASDKCTEKKKEELPNANITTNINIHNIVNGTERLLCCDKKSETVCPPTTTCPPSSPNIPNSIHKINESLLCCYLGTACSPTIVCPPLFFPPLSQPPLSQPPLSPPPLLPPPLSPPPVLPPPLLPPPLTPPSLSICPPQTCSLHNFMYGQSNFGCQYWNLYPCIQPWTNPVEPIDCSGCGYNYRCHAYCYYTTHNIIKSSSCKSPYCVGGGQ